MVTGASKALKASTLHGNQKTTIKILDAWRAIAKDNYCDPMRTLGLEQVKPKVRKLGCFKGEICVPGGVSIMPRCRVTFALSVIIFAAASRALVASDAEALCPHGNATLRGTYMLRGEGTIVGVGPITAVGWLTYDGKGNVVNSFMSASVNGVISTFTISGPYTVNNDCAGSTDLSGSHYNFVVSPDGNRVNWIQTDPGTVVSGSIVRLKRRAEDD